MALAGMACPMGVPLRGFTAQGGLLCGLNPPAVCGNETLEDGEEFDPAPGLFQAAPVNPDTCRFDFSQVTQLYCGGSCSYDGPLGCDQSDADTLCKLKTGNPRSVATSFQITGALDEPGFACAGYGEQVRRMSGRGVDVPVYFSDTSISASHGSGGATTVTNVTCSNP